jgi:hypothetical protein
MYGNNMPCGIVDRQVCTYAYEIYTYIQNPNALSAYRYNTSVTFMNVVLYEGLHTGQVQHY